jgi:hypothetical protein
MAFPSPRFHLTAAAKIPGIDQATFQSIAAKAKSGCPVSKLMNVDPCLLSRRCRVAKAAAPMNFIRERPTLARRAAGRSAGLSAERR